MTTQGNFGIIGIYKLVFFLPESFLTMARKSPVLFILMTNPLTQTKRISLIALSLVLGVTSIPSASAQVVNAPVETYESAVSDNPVRIDNVAPIRPVLTYTVDMTAYNSEVGQTMPTRSRQLTGRRLMTEWSPQISCLSARRSVFQSSLVTRYLRFTTV